MANRQITLALSSHRLEVLPFAEERMRRHQTIILEEPPNPRLDHMLLGHLAIEQYIDESNFEFPLFAHQMCRLLRHMHSEGRTILQVEPFLAVLEEIHDFFSRGGRPDEIQPGCRRYDVYNVERRWTGALLRYYERSPAAPFDEVVAAVMNFARADAVRGRLRDSLRADALAKHVDGRGPIYIEAGYTHLWLLRQLRLRLPRHHVGPAYLMAPVVRKLVGKRQIFGPGDLLTLLYTFRPAYVGGRANLLAARSLIYTKILHKEEFIAGADRFPHTRDEIECLRLIEDLSYEQCSTLFKAIRAMDAAEAREVVLASR